MDEALEHYVANVSNESIQNRVWGMSYKLVANPFMHAAASRHGGWRGRYDNAVG